VKITLSNGSKLALSNRGGTGVNFFADDGQRVGFETADVLLVFEAVSQIIALNRAAQEAEADAH
jgi:hypothetical protein